MAKPKGLVVVTWRDSTAGHAPGLARRRTVGWVSKWGRREVVLRQTKDETGPVSTTWTIPRCQVVKVTELLGVQRPT